METPAKTRLRSVERVGIAIVLLHFLVNVAHAAAHTNLHIDMNAWQSVYILLIILLLPLVSAVLLWRRSRNGFRLLFWSMLGSLLFGGYYHFIAAGADNVASLGEHAWAPAFQVTAVLLALTETAGVVTGVIGLRPELAEKRS
jgi:CHASE2 domain-containing sensor protein